MKCEEYDWVAHLKGEVTEAEREAGRSHFESCPRCTRELERLDRVIRAFSKVERIEPSRGFTWKVRQAFAAAHPEFLETVHRTPGEGLGWWAALRAQFSFIPAWAISVSAHVVLLTIAALILFTPPDPEEELRMSAPRLAPKEHSVPPEWNDDWKTVAPRGGRDRVGAHHHEEDREFTEPGDFRGGAPAPRDDRQFSRNPFDPKGWTPDADRIEIDRRLLGFLECRIDRDRKERLRAVPGLAKSIGSALQWLAEHQSEDGSWPAPKGFQTGVTGLALLAFLGDGHTHRRGEFAAVVDRGLRHLLGLQKMNGLIGDEDGNTMYDHAIAATALLEAHLMEKDAALRMPVSAAVMYTLKAQNSAGGWGYTTGDDENDTSVLGWQVVLLRLYRAVDPAAPVASLNQARIRLEASTNRADGRVGYRGRGQFPHREFAMTAVGMFAHMMATAFTDDALLSLQESVLLSEGNPAVHMRPENHASNDLYFWYFGSLSLYQRGGPGWEHWSRCLLKDLQAAQRQDGSWPVNFDKWSLFGGSVYTTSLSALILETCTRYPRFVR